MKRVIALLLALVMMLSFAACAGKKNDETQPESEATESVDGIVEMDEDTDTEATETDVEAEAELEVETAADGTIIATNKQPAKKPVKVPANAPTSGLKPTDKPVKPDQEYHPVTPTQHIYKITVKKTDGGKIVTVDGTEYNLRHAKDQAALIKRIQDEKDNDLLGQLYKADPTIAVDLGLLAMEGGNVLSYTYNIEGQYFWIDDIHSWQQNFGFNPLYDFGAQLIVMYYDTVRLEYKYTHPDPKAIDHDYANQPWMIQLWKGQYGYVFIGGEIGVYTKYKETDGFTNNDLRHYDCATKDLLKMQQIMWRADYNGVLHPLFKTDAAYHWWSTGFVPGALKSFASRKELTMEAAIDFTPYPGMARIVGDTMKKAGFREINKKDHNIYNPDTFYIEGNKLTFTWRDIQHRKTVVPTVPSTEEAKPSKPAESKPSKPTESKPAESSTSKVEESKVVKPDTSKAATVSTVA